MNWTLYVYVCTGQIQEHKRKLHVLKSIRYSNNAQAANFIDMLMVFASYVFYFRIVARSMDILLLVTRRCCYWYGIYGIHIVS